MVEISTSILGANKNKIIDTIYNLEKAKTDYFHIDVMDGEFVKNNTHDIMLEYCEYLSNISKVPMDVHLMVNDVKNYIDSYCIFNPNIITFHYEACNNDEQVMDIVKYAKLKCRRVGLSIKPNTPVEKIYKFLPYIHLVLIMTVEPGRGGQELLNNMIDKIKQISEYRREHNLDFDIEADGGIKVENSQKLVKSGVDIIVAGSSILSSNNYTETIKKLR